MVSKTVRRSSSCLGPRSQAHQSSGRQRYPFNRSLSLIVMIRLSTVQGAGRTD